ncbi:glycosyltransferase [Nostoc sphaeroides CHAB 2801]|uniref:glycosyltransferase n=1 Tax=Nostoc sphaeroides TaxID=446679 RepID=UPI000E46A4E9|nr:glycosyltransferase [Nostoc sphaeroides]MCC5629690.1 glycosyltransferase [Nostoc sphaeroides CHAB 2801]
MKIVQVNYKDTVGYRFNGGALIPWLRSCGHNAVQAVGIKQSLNDSSVNIVPHPWRFPAEFFARLVHRVERAISIHNVLYPQSFLLPFNPAFKAADVVHYHIIHNEFFSYLAFPWLTRLKPTVWSLHDPWAITGHCVHPFDCKGWKTGCHPCPHLDYPFAIRKDRAWLNYKLKNFAYKYSQLHLIVASQWMQSLVEQSPLLSRFPVHHIPFGLDLNLFSPGNKAEAKAKLGIPTDQIVISLRSLQGPYKGLEYSIKALELLPANAAVHVLTCQAKSLLSSLADKFQITELGEIDGDAAMVDFFRATDIHLMPSMAESFGMMAIEAAACGVPSVVFSGTPLPEVCFAPEGGIAVERGDSQKLAEAIYSLIRDSQKRELMGFRARELAEQNYDFDRYATRIMSIYAQAIDKHSRAKLW